MGTTCNLLAVTSREQARRAETGLANAEAELRRLEALLSTWIEASPVSRFNEAGANQILDLPQELHEVLTIARSLYEATQGSFDITARPLIELWREAPERRRVPAHSALAAARLESTWDAIELSEGTARKSLPTVRVDIDGIAKGYAIDQAVEVLQRSGASGGMIDVGGDLRIFGQGPEDQHWTVGIRSPFEDRVWAEIEVESGAVCSSGDYARFVEVGGQRFNHIIDPRTGSPASETHAVTVVGPDAAIADAWATALSVLGPSGFEILDRGLQAMVVSGEAHNYRVHVTAGFRELLVRAAFELEE